MKEDESGCLNVPYYVLLTGQPSFPSEEMPSSSSGWASSTRKWTTWPSRRLVTAQQQSVTRNHPAQVIFPSQTQAFDPHLSTG